MKITARFPFRFMLNAKAAQAGDGEKHRVLEGHASVNDGGKNRKFTAGWQLSKPIFVLHHPVLHLHPIQLFQQRIPENHHGQERAHALTEVHPEAGHITGHAVRTLITDSSRKTEQVSSSGPTSSSIVRKPNTPMTTGFLGSLPFANRKPASSPPAP